MVMAANVEDHRMPLLSVSDVARQLGVKPGQVTQLFYERRLRDDLCPIVGGRRIIQPEHLEVIAMELRRKGISVRALPAEDRSRMF